MKIPKTRWHVSFARQNNKMYMKVQGFSIAYDTYLADIWSHECAMVAIQYKTLIVINWWFSKNCTKQMFL